MDFSDNHPMVPPAVRITVLLRLVSEGFQDAFGVGPAWLELPAADLAALRQAVGAERVEELTRTIGLREGASYHAGGPTGTVSLSDAAYEGVLGLMGLAALPADVLVEETAEGPSYKVPDDWFIAEPAGGGSSAPAPG
ncbi:MAG TPA: hypothetical protein VFA45_22125 [Actinomycetes bacterium]|jgi:hypothetical protein|nr:hypothetical protein [Actinomycetes bacterium]